MEMTARSAIVAGKLNQLKTIQNLKEAEIITEQESEVVIRTFLSNSHSKEKEKRLEASQA